MAAVTHKRSNASDLNEEGGIRKKLKVKCEVQEDGTCEILNTDDADITLEGELLPGSESEVTTTTITTIETLDDHRAYMDEFAAHLIARKKTMLVPDEKRRAIVSYLQHGTPISPRLKFWLNMKKMMIVTLPELDLNNELVVPREGRDGGTTGLLRVVPVSQLYPLVSSLHSPQHTGYKKVKLVVDREYYGVPRSYVQAFCRTCPSCANLQPLPIPMPPREPPRHPPQPSVCRLPRWGNMDRRMLGRSLQVDLMDMEHCVDGEFHHICHVVEHFSQFHFLFPLKTSSPSEVARGLEERVMAYLGPPRVLFSSSDPQLVYKVSRILFGGWGSDMTLGRSHTSQMTSHKGIANTNELVMKQLVKLRAYHYDPAAHFPWTTWLPRVMYCLNMHGSLPSKHSKGQVMRKLGHDSRPGIATMFPYQVMFGRAPPGKCPCWCEERGHDTDQDTDGMEEEEQERDDRAKHSLLIAKTELVSECDQY